MRRRERAVSGDGPDRATGRDRGMGGMSGMDARSSWAVGGGLLLGLGAGFFVLTRSALAFVGCVLGGIGLGLLAAAVLSTFGRR